ncbi:hypothetical protein [Alloactinosynnema sp. L-07]|uniref:hypothetical protein n=1 Tax=Alloactinosynnema sp. L-07 TaxID=1653480 RepID=UPI00065EF634|nr:hypothetical protein [Alloactinosynnema sp. L-07]CRK61009.1 hypothetical protein [Alloactinosynnema sp. L-07]
MSIEELRAAIGEAETLIAQGLAILQAAPEPIESAVACLGVLLESSVRLEADAAQGSLVEAAEQLVAARQAAKTALEAAELFKAVL